MTQNSTKRDNVSSHLARAVGQRREALGLTLRALAQRSGVSSSMISDIERGAKSPTVSTLSALADALAVSIAALVEAGPSSPPRLRVVRASEHVTIANPASGASRESFGPAIGPSKVEFVRYMLPARSVAGPFDAHHGGTIEHIHLAAGRLRVTLGSEAATLEAGDSCSCLADAPHAFENIDSKNDALLYLVIEGR